MGNVMAKTFDQFNANQKAIELVKTALESSSLKLGGPTGYHSAVGADASGKRDAEYLMSLINSLAENIGKLQH